MKVREQVLLNPQETYPELYLPAGLYHYLTADSAKPKEPVAPEKPIAQKEPETSSVVFIALFIFIFFIVYKILQSVDLLSSASVIISLFASILLTYLAGSKIDNARQQPIREKNKAEEDRYKMRLSYYYEQNQAYKEEINRYNYLGDVDYRNWQIKTIFENIRPDHQYIAGTDEVIEGAMEGSFRMHLVEFFCEKNSPLEIIHNYKKENLVERKESDSGYDIFYYYPDIVISDGNGFLMDVEIDEAYSLDTKEPIHYLDFQYENGDRKRISIDDARNKSFTDSGWIVLRFSETQVMKYPNECAEIIENLYYCLRDYRLFVDEEWDARLVEAKWDAFSSVKMADANVRENALKRH